jgi:hypothetical protein
MMGPGYLDELLIFQNNHTEKGVVIIFDAI